MATLEVHRVSVLRKNYIWLAREATANVTTTVDPALAEPVLVAFAVKG